MTLRPIPDRAEVAIDFPEKTFTGSFGGGSAYEVAADAEGVTLRLVRTRGSSRTIELHVHYHLLAEVLAETARELTEKHLPAEVPRRALHDAVEALRAAVRGAGEG